MDFDITRLRILVIDDELFMRQLTHRVLDELGIYQVTAAEDGFDALTKFSTTRKNFDLVICDLARISQTHLGGVSSGADEPGCGSICVALRQSGPGLIVCRVF